MVKQTVLSKDSEDDKITILGDFLYPWIVKLSNEHRAMEITSLIL